MHDASSTEGPDLDVGGPAAPPRQNGELVFESPWESRLFGLTIALCDQGALGWEEFRQELIGQICRFSPSDRDAVGSAPFDYYRHWQCALEAVLDRLELCSKTSLRSRAEQLAARPHGHDH